MLALVFIFLATFLLATLAVRLYRLLFGWVNRRTIVVGRQRRTTMMKLSSQQGYISLLPESLKSKQQPVRSIVLNKSKGGIKAPWGW